MKKFMFLFFIFFAFCFRVSAAHLDLYRIEGVYSSQLDIDNNRYYSYRQNRYVMDGRTVYCVEPGIDINTREYSSFDLSYSSFSSDIIEKLSLIGYFGYDYPLHQSDKYFLATQELVWELVGNNEAHFTTGINDTGDYINIDYEKNEIMRLVNNYYLKPSFDSSVVDEVVGQRLVLTDSNHVLSDYNVISGNAYIDGDNLIVDVDVGIHDVKLLRKKYDNNESIYYMASNSQDFMYLRAFEVYSSVSVNGYIPYSNVSIYKTGEVLTDFVDGSFVYEEKGLDGIVFGLYADQDIYINNELIYIKDDLVQELITSNGYASSINIPNGKYYLKELDTYDNLIICDDIQIDVNNDSINVYTYELNLKNERKKSFISINKQGEVFDNINNSYYEGLGGVKFGLYSHDDIYNFYNRLLVSKDELISTFITDDSGNILIDIELPICSYYFKELETFDSYILDNSVYDGVINNDDFITYNVGSIVNYLKKGNVIVNKYDIYGTGLDGACFQLYKDNRLIYEGSTVGGNIHIDNLPYGQYKLYEVSAPDGYIKNDVVYDIFLDSPIAYVDVYNEKLPITSDIYFLKKSISYISIFFGLVILYDKTIENS